MRFTPLGTYSKFKILKMKNTIATVLSFSLVFIWFSENDWRFHFTTNWGPLCLLQKESTTALEYWWMVHLFGNQLLLKRASRGKTFWSNDWKVATIVLLKNRSLESVQKLHSTSFVTKLCRSHIPFFPNLISMYFYTLCIASLFVTLSFSCLAPSVVSGSSKPSPVES